MAATNFTPIQLYHSTTASAAPTSGNLVNGELAINITDGKLYYKDNGGTVQIIASKGTGTIGGSTTQVQYNLSGALAGSSNFVFDGTTATINTLNLTNALGATYGGTAQSSWTTGDLLYASGSNTLAKLGIGLNTYILTSNGSIPGWAAPSAISVNTATNLAGGAAGSVPYQSGAGATTFLSIGTANQVVTSTGSAPQWSSGLSITTLTASDAVTFSATTQNIALGTSQTSGTFTVGGTAQTGNIAIDRSTKTHTLNIGTGITESGQTKTINIGTAGDTGSTTAITIGSANGTTITVNGTVAASTLDLTNLEVTNIKAKDGTASMTLADTTGIITLSATAGTANGVLYLNGSRAVTSGSALVFNGTALGIGTPSPDNLGVLTTEVNGNSLNVSRTASTTGRSGWVSQNTAETIRLFSEVYGASATNSGFGLTLAGYAVIQSQGTASNGLVIGSATADPLVLGTSDTERLRITSGGQVNIGGNFTSTNNTLQVTGNAAIGYTTAAPTTGLIVAGNVGIGTDSPAVKLHLYGATTTSGRIETTGSSSYATLDLIHPSNTVSFANRGDISQMLVDSGSWALGIRTLAAQPLFFSTSGNERARIDSSGTLILRQSSNAANTSVSFNTTVQNALTLDSSGNLGVGTPTPDSNSRVHAYKASGNSYIRVESPNDVNTAFWSINSQRSWLAGMLGGTSGFYQIYDLTAAASRVTVDTSGNVGLGVTPSANAGINTLSVAGQGGGFAALTMGGNATQSGYVGYNMGTTSTSDTWKYITADTGSVIFFKGNEVQFRQFGSGSAGATTNGTQAMTLDASGNLLVGATSSSSGITLERSGATSAEIKLNQTGAGGRDYRIASTGSGYGTAGQLIFYDVTASAERARITSGGQFAMTNDGTNAAPAISFTNDLDTGIFRPTTNQLGFATAGVQAMTLDASGRLGIGETSPVTDIDILRASGDVSTRFRNGTGTGIVGVRSDNNFTELRAVSNHGIQFSTNNTEVARITSSGYFKASNAGTYQNSTGDFHELRSSTSGNVTADIRHTNNTNPYGIIIGFTAATPNGTGNYFLNCLDSTAQRAEIRSNGGLANYQSNNVDLSDIRTKTDISPLASYWNKIAALEIVTYKYKDQTHDDLNIGVIAQQVEQIAPEFVDPDGFGETPEDGVPLKTIYNKDLTFAAIKALQEAMARIEKLEAEVAALKGV